MSTGAFEAAKYKANDGKVYPARAQPETKALTLNSVANSYPTESVTSGLPTIKSNRSSREFGVKMRTVTVLLTASGSGATAGYVSGNRYTVPWFDFDTYGSVAKEQTGTYQGVACKAVALGAEDIN